MDWTDLIGCDDPQVDELHGARFAQDEDGYCEHSEAPTHPPFCVGGCGTPFSGEDPTYIAD
jgi:hypothetical protein